MGDRYVRFDANECSASRKHLLVEVITKIKRNVLQNKTVQFLLVIV